MNITSNIEALKYQHKTTGLGGPGKIFTCVYVPSFQLELMEDGRVYRTAKPLITLEAGEAMDEMEKTNALWDMALINKIDADARVKIQVPEKYVKRIDKLVNRREMYDIKEATIISGIFNAVQ